MSLLTAVISFAAVAGLVTIIPGLDTAMVVRSSVSHGRKHGFATALGVNTGTLVWGAGAAIGVSALLEASTLGYTIVRIAGALYMVWLGSRLLLKAFRDRRDGGPLLDPAPAAPRGLPRSWSAGLMTNLLTRGSAPSTSRSCRSSSPPTARISRSACGSACPPSSPGSQPGHAAQVRGRGSGSGGGQFVLGAQPVAEFVGARFLEMEEVGALGDLVMGGGGLGRLELGLAQPGAPGSGLAGLFGHHESPIHIVDGRYARV